MEEIVLESLIDRVVPKKSIFNKPFTSSTISSPWLIPSSSTCTEWKKINQILKKSMEIQTSWIPGTNFTDFIISNCCLAISGLLQYYLKTLSLCDNIKVVYGILRTPNPHEMVRLVVIQNGILQSRSELELSK